MGFNGGTAESADGDELLLVFLGLGGGRAGLRTE